MKIVKMGIGRIRPYSKNNRKHDERQVERVAESIRRFGFNQPIVVDEDGEILVGHCRRLAAIRLGITEVPVVVLPGLSDIEKRAYRIIDNKTADDATIDHENLQAELERLKLDFTGFEFFGLGEFHFPEPPSDDEPSHADEEETPSEWAGIISLRVPAQDIESFEERLDALIRKFPRIIKEKDEDDGSNKKKRKHK